MGSQEIDLDLWLNKTLLDRQHQLKARFIEILEEVGNAVSNEELKGLHSPSKGKKISKGNDLLGYPYQVLDLIRDFNPDSGMNLRVLNWFGHGLFVLLFLGKTIRIPIESMLENGFEFGLCDDPWDFGKLILSEETTGDKHEILDHRDRFQIWIKKISAQADKSFLTNEILEEIKNVIQFTLNSSLK